MDWLAILGLSSSTPPPAAALSLCWLLLCALVSFYDRTKSNERINLNRNQGEKKTHPGLVVSNGR